jgi:hypothetical protein
MMAFTKVKVEGVPLSVELANEFAALSPLPGERDERDQRREYLERHLRNGTSGGPCWARGRCLSDGSVYRLDGQHSSKLLSNLPPDIAFPTGLLVTIDDWEFDTLEQDGPAVFNLFNHPKSARTNEDAVGIYRARAKVLNDISKPFLVKVGDGIAEYERGRDGGMVLVPRERGSYFLLSDQYRDFTLWIGRFRTTKNAAFMKRPALVAEMLADWLYSSEHATEFWQYVLTESHPEADHETRALAEQFRQWSMQKKYKGADYRKRAASVWKHYLREVRVAA